MERNSDVLKRGAVFVDENDSGSDPRLLFYLEDAVQDSVILPSGNRRVISKHVHFVELKADGSAANAGFAPYLDYRAASASEHAVIRTFLDQQTWLKSNVEETAAGYAIANVIPAHVAEVRKRKKEIIDKTSKAVKERLTAEIQYWDFRAIELKRKEQAGKTNARLNSQNAQKRAEDLAARMQKRLHELENERLISAMPPVIVGGAIIIPRGLLDRLTGAVNTFTADAAARREIEEAAMNAVMEIETSLGFTPHNVSTEKIGYDIESAIPPALRASSGIALRFIEVKGRAKGAGTVTVSKNEILTAFNKPDEYLLAIVEVDGGNTRTQYLRRPFRERPDFAATSINYDIAELINGSELILARG